MNYLIEAIKGKYHNVEENRLTQIFAATFNNSKVFRKLFLDFIKHSSNVELIAKTQQVHKATKNMKPHLDISICRVKNSIPSILIENKVEANLTPDQLKNYNKVEKTKNSKKIALVKYGFIFNNNLGWKICRWADLYQKLKHYVETKSPDKVDEFIINNLLDYLEVMEMDRKDIITKEELVEWAKSISALRECGKVFCSVKNCFTTANKFVNILGGIYEKSKSKKVISNRIKKNYQFRPIIGYWVNKKEQKIPWIGLDIELGKRYKGIKHIVTGISFDQGNKYEICTYVADLEQWIIGNKQVRYTRKDITFEHYAKQAISCWVRWLK